MYPGLIKQHSEDWQVRERCGFTPAGEGEHAYFYVRKEGLNTEDLVRSAAQAFEVARLDVGYAGRKDKHAITDQWLSVRTTQDQWPDIPQTQCLAQARHTKKLRIGELLGNDFELVLRQPKRSSEEIHQALVHGFANAFGPQRVSDANVQAAQEWLLHRRERRVDRRGRKQTRRDPLEGWHLSVLRAYLFNCVLSARLAHNEGEGMRAIEGDVLVQGFPSAPLWGRGRSSTQFRAQELESLSLTPHRELSDALEHTGVRQARRPMWIKVGDLKITPLAEQDLCLRFFLPAGVYATALLAHAERVAHAESTYE